MKNFKVLKELPGLSAGTIILQDILNPETYVIKNTYKHSLSIKFINTFPEFFEETNYLTTTEDGVDVKENDSVAWCIYNVFSCKWEYAYNLGVVKFHLLDNQCLTKKDTYKIFSTKEKAIEFCKKINTPKIITLCGSTKFKDQFITEQKRLTLEGNIVISVGCFGHSGDTEVLTIKVKEMLDRLHKRKIDLSDEIFVINVGGYIGESTKNEIEYAISVNKIIKYLEN